MEREGYPKCHSQLLTYGLMALDALSPTVITGWLECEHSLTLRMKRSSAPQAFGAFADLVRAKGLAHEEAVVARLEARGLKVHRVADKGDLKFEQWATVHEGLLESSDADVIYQMPMVFEGIKGVADFLIRVEAEPGFSSWEPVDAKLARKEAKPGHLLQLCFYADAVRNLTGTPPKQIHLELGSGQRESYRFEEFGPYWRRMKLELGRVAEQGGPPRETQPEPCRFCDFCDFQKVCEEQWRAEDSLVFVANLLKADRETLKVGGIETLAALADAEAPPAEMPVERFHRVANQAKLQLRHRDHPSEAIPFERVAPGEDPIWGHGYSHLPKSDEGDVFFDLEGHPLFTAAAGIFFLFGLWYRKDGAWQYEAIWAHSLEEQTAKAVEVVEFFENRRLQFPDYHVYHYNHTERSSLEAMVADTEASIPFAHLKATGLFVDLLTVVRNSFQMGIESYGLKDVEHVTGFVREGKIEAGSGAVLLYEEYVESNNNQLLEEIAQYNRNDVQSTMALRDWLVANRPEGGRWRETEFPEYENHVDLDEVSFKLLQYEPGTVQHLMGNLIGYWRRERSAQFTPLREQVKLPVADLLDDQDVITGLMVVEAEEPRVNKVGNMTYKATFTWPEQKVSPKWKAGSCFIGGNDGETGFANSSGLDLEERRITVSWSRKEDESQDLNPVSLIADDWVRPSPKDALLLETAQVLLQNPESLPEVTRQILLKAKPRFVEGGGPPKGMFSDHLDEMMSWVTQLDRSIVSVQGPPGTGKTYRGARLVRKLIQEGKRVGISAPSHVAVSNFIEGVVEHYEEENDLGSLQACQKIGNDTAKPLEGVITYVTDNKKAANGDFQLVGGTSWFFCSKELREHPVDYLFID